MNIIQNPFVDMQIKQQDMLTPTIPATMKETYSQCYEDIIMDSILRAHVKINGINSGITFVEIGANHPVSTSSSYLFQRKYNTTGILIEANPNLVSELQKHRPGNIIINKAVVDSDIESVDFYISRNNETSSLDDRFVVTRTPGIQDKITVQTIRANEILEMVKDSLVILSVDVEGFDLRILKDIDFNTYRPVIIQVEPSEDYSPGSTQNIIDFLTSQDYELVAETDVNLIFKNSK